MSRSPKHKVQARRGPDRARSPGRAGGAVVALVVTGLALAAPTVAAQTLDGSGAPVAPAAVAPLPTEPALPPMGADDAHREPRFADGDVYGLVRGRLTRVTDFAVDETGTTHGRSLYAMTRLVVGGEVHGRSRRYGLVVEIDALNGQVAGETTELGLARGDDTFRVPRHANDEWLAVLPRKAYGYVDLPIARLQVGVQTFSWGTGFLANDGLDEPDFGDAWRGNVVARAALITQPWRDAPAASPAARGVTLFLAGDHVLADDNAQRRDGDRAWAGVLGGRVDTEDVSVGVLEAVRFQTDRADPLRPDGEQTELRVFATDLYGVWRLPLADGRRLLRIESESALLAGTTDRPYLDETFEDGARVRAFGSLLRVRLDDHVGRWTAKLEGGYASGDNDPRDDTVRQFQFHSDYNVGLILFDQVLPMLAARAVDRVFDPELLDVPPSGTRYLTPQGTVTNALYLYPFVRYRPWSTLDLRAGYVVATTASDLVDPYFSGLRGGYNRGYGDVADASGLLGHEIDAAVDYTIEMPGRVSLELGAEGGVFIPGGALDGVDIGTVWLARGRADLRF